MAGGNNSEPSMKEGLRESMLEQVQREVQGKDISIKKVDLEKQIKKLPNLLEVSKLYDLLKICYLNFEKKTNTPKENHDLLKEAEAILKELGKLQSLGIIPEGKIRAFCKTKTATGNKTTDTTWKQSPEIAIQKIMDTLNNCSSHEVFINVYTKLKQQQGAVPPDYISFKEIDAKIKDRDSIINILKSSLNDFGLGLKDKLIILPCFEDLQQLKPACYLGTEKFQALVNFLQNTS